MKAILLLLLLISPTLGWAQLDVFACEPEWADLTQKLAGDKVNVFSATTAMQDPHHVEARPSLIAKMRRADLVVCTGADLEVGWLPLLIRRSGNPKVQPNQPGYFEAAMEVERLDIPVTLDRSAGDVHSAGNPHVHLDPERVQAIALALHNRLGEIDGVNKPYYQEKLKRFNQQWNQHKQRWDQQAAKLKDMKIVVQHQDWIYLNQWIGLEQIATIEPKPGVPPSAADQKRLLQTLQSHPPSAIILAAYQNDKAAKWLSDRLSVPIVRLPFTVGGDEQSGDLVALFDRTLFLLQQYAKAPL
jgi:zinc/manganese transport system substrate-binding protein